MKIAILGKGSVGRSLAELMTKAGHEVCCCGKGEPVKNVVTEDHDVVVLALPFEAVKKMANHKAAKVAIAGKVVIDAVNPVKSDWSPETDFGIEGDDAKDILCAGEAIQYWFPESKIVKAFNTVFADNLTEERLVVGDAKVSTFVAGNDDDARKVVLDLANEIGFAAVETGPLMTARYLEAMAHLNIQLAMKMDHGTNSGFLYFDRTNKTAGD